MSEKKLLFIIRYVPMLFIILLSIFITYIFEAYNDIHTEEEKQRTTNIYVTLNNDELKEEVFRVYDYISQKNETAITLLKSDIKQKVYEAHAIATKIYEDNKNIKSKTEILELIKTALGSIIFNKGRGYYFIDNIDGIKLLQPLNKDLENKNLLNFTDAKGYKFVQTIVKTIKNKEERFDSYYWYKNGNKTQAYEKISFYKYFEPFDVAIGTGEYIEDYYNEMKTDIIEHIQNIKLDDNGYIFLLNSQSKVLAHQNRTLIGKDLITLKDKKLTDIVQKIMDISEEKNKEGFLTYKKSLNTKTSFIKIYDQWAWVIGTGYNDNDLNEFISQNILAFNKTKNENFKFILMVSFITTASLLILSIFISNILEKKFKEFRNTIKEEEEQFRNLFEFSNIGLSISDEKGRLIRVNTKFMQIFGYSKEEDLINKNWKDVSSNDSIEQESEKYTQLLNGQIDQYSVEKLYVKEDGSTFDAYITANSLKIKSNVKYILSSIIDISEIKTKDSLLFQQSKMASMGEMLANIAHQWRQPLSVISTASSGVKLNMEFGVLKDEDLLLSMNGIHDSAQYLSQTINDFKDFFKPEKSKSTFTIKHATTQTLKLISAQFKDNEIQIIEDIQDIEIKSFENELIQVLINMFNNARDALVDIKEEKFIFVHAEKKDNNLVISIKDNAGGIPQDIIKKIFEPYFTTKHKSQGTGIGLYMVNEIMQKQIKGFVDVRNVRYTYLGKHFIGAEFKLFIPLDDI